MIDRVIVAVYRRLLPGPIGAEACADLDDGYRLRQKRFGPIRAWLWYAGHLLLPRTWQLAVRLRARRGGGPAVTGEAKYDVAAGFMHDCRFVLRSLRRSPLFTGSVAGTIALCLMANAVVLSSLYSLILKPLPFDDSERLVQIVNVGAPGFVYQPGDDVLGGQRASRSTWLQYRDFEEHAKLFEKFAFRTSFVQITETTGSVPVKSPMHGVSSGFFDLMKVRPVTGRFFSPDEFDPGPGHVLVLTQSTWETEYGSDPAAVGRDIRLGSEVPYTIVGVAPRSVETFDHRAKYFVPFVVPRAGQQGRVNGALDLWARLNEGVSREVGLTELQALESRWYDEVATPKERDHHDTFSDHLDFGAPHPLEGSLVLLQIAALLVLGVGTLNVFTLLLVRVNHRSRELSVRIALGARRSVIRRLMVIESAMLTGLGAGLGLALTTVALRSVNDYLTILAPSSAPIALDGVVVAMICGAALCGVCALGMMPFEPVLRRTNIAPTSSRTATGTVGSRRLAGRLVVAEVTFAFALLIGAGLLMRSFLEVVKVDVGFDSARVVSGMLDYNTLRPLYSSGAETIALKRNIVEGMQSIPGVEAVAFAGFDPPRPNLATMHIEGNDANVPSPRAWLPVSADYFEAMGMSILDGRGFDENSASLEEVIVDESFGRRYLGGRSPLGTRVMLGAYSPTAPWARIVGVVNRVSLLGQEERDGVPVVYTHESVNRGSFTIAIVVRAARPDGPLGRDVERKLREIDPRLPMTRFLTFEESNERLLVGRKGMTILLASFAALALLVAIIGLYAVLSLDVVHRQRELGIRVVLGASPRRVIGMVLREGLSRVALGLMFGLVGAVAISMSLRARLFDVDPFEPSVYGTVAAIFAIAGLVASYFPARRAAGHDALRTFR